MSSTSGGDADQRENCYYDAPHSWGVGRAKDECDECDAPRCKATNDDVRCRRVSGHEGDHVGDIDPDTAVRWSAFQSAAPIESKPAEPMSPVGPSGGTSKPEGGELDLAAVSEKWLRQCGACDGGLAMSCTHPDEDYRPTMGALVAEVERLRQWSGQLDRELNDERNASYTDAVHAKDVQARAALERVEATLDTVRSFKLALGAMSLRQKTTEIQPLIDDLGHILQGDWNLVRLARITCPGCTGTGCDTCDNTGTVPGERTW